MARKKIVSISRKPSADDMPMAGVEPVATGSPPPLSLKLQAYPEAPETTPSAPALSPLGRVVYGTVYCVSYGVVYGAILLGQFIPGSGLVGHALLDGAGSARRSFERRPGRCADAKMAETSA